MKIGVDARFLLSGAWSGVEEYSHKLLSAILEVDRKNDYLLFANSYKGEIMNVDGIDAPVKRFRFPNRFLNFSFRFLRAPKIDKMLDEVDLFFSPNNFFGEVSRDCKKVITFHDLSFVRQPELFSVKQRLWHRMVEPKRKARRADRIISVSDSTKEDLIDLFGVERDKVEVIHSGVEGSLFGSVASEELERVRTKYRLPGDFILSLATIEPRKNIRTLIEALNMLNRNKLSKTKLVLAGNVGWLFEKDLKKYLNDQVVLIGHVDAKDRKALLHQANVFVYPSLYEGFGFPPLEAMACRVPVVASNVSSLPEVLSDAALLVNPYNALELAEAIVSLANDEGLRDAFVEKGLEQAKKYSWVESARKTVDVFEEAVK